MNSKKVRQTFIDFFIKKGHKEVASSSLVPINDSTLLFTNAGMIQFKDIFLGSEKTNLSRATSSQKCIRAGGKHNDLENVGYTLRHHTFFEMLGNFSFGDYFKEEAIEFAWELLTKEYKIPEEKLWVTVHINDKESEKIWLEKIGISKDRISRLDEDNFWSMGDTGPCGPCSEIFYDHGPDFEGVPPEEGQESGDRYIEIYNLVFMQFERNQDGKMKDLPKPSVDTGMGLERITALLQGTNDNYKTDLFAPLIKNIAKKIGTNDLTDPSLRVIADHLRSSCFLLADGVSIGNEGRSYVLRRIIRRALRHAYKINPEADSILSQLANGLIADLKDTFPELSKQSEIIKSSLEEEERQFIITLRQGMKILEDELLNLSGDEISGDLAFMLYDTYGFPLDMTLDLAREKSLSVDLKQYEALMEDQRFRAKKYSGFDSLIPSSINIQKSSNFIGYEEVSSESSILGIFQNGEEVENAQEGNFVFIFDKTPFYAESGGQVGDIGSLRSAQGSGNILDTKKIGDHFLHIIEVTKGFFSNQDKVFLEIDTDRRKKIISNHSATHLMHASLREKIGTHVEQKGSLVDDEKLRFDFSHKNALSFEEIHQIESQVNLLIKDDLDTEILEKSYDDAIGLGALAFFGDKYGERVRVIKIAGDFSVELCGGTHVKKTGDISKFKIISESSISSGVRRIEAITGTKALDYLKEQEDSLREISIMLNVPTNQIAKETKSLDAKLKSLHKKLKSFEQKNNERLILNLADKFEIINDTNLLIQRVDNINLSSLRGSLDSLKEEKGKSVVVIAGNFEGKAMLIISVSKDLIDSVDARNLLESCADIIGAKGGGRSDYAQAGGDRIDKIDDALEASRNFFNK